MEERMATYLFEPRSETQPSSALASRWGIFASLMLAAMATIGFTIAILTPPHSGAWCTANCTAYPYVDAGRFFPRDYWWMIPGYLLAPLLMTVSACVHFCIGPARRLWSFLAVCIAMAATTVIGLDYFMQVLAVQPSLAHHESDGIAILTQYNPHGLFLVMEDLAYLLMADALLLIAMALPPAPKPAKSARWTMAVVGSLAFLAFLFMAVRYGTEMALPFELAVITIVWLGLIPSGILLALWFRRVRLSQ
jgi:hypothetical protein